MEIMVVCSSTRFDNILRKRSAFSKWGGTPSILLLYTIICIDWERLGK